MLTTFTNSKQEFVIVTFALYLFSIVVFANIYFAIYGRDRRNFAFHADIAEQHREEARSRLNARLQSASERARLLEEALVEVAAHANLSNAKREEIVLVTATGALVHFEPTVQLVPSGGPTPRSEPSTRLELRDPVGNIVWQTEWAAGPDSSEPGYFGKSIKRFAEQQRKEEQSTTMSLEAVEKDAAAEWTLLDFLYFSTIIQSTVGLGDMLPNSTISRRIVAIQIIVGYAILVLLLNIVLSV
jgi:ion channel